MIQMSPDRQLITVLDKPILKNHGLLLFIDREKSDKTIALKSAVVRLIDNVHPFLTFRALHRLYPEAQKFGFLI